MLVRRARGTVGSTVDPPPAAVGGAERIDELDHQTVLRAVGAGGERLGDVDEAHPQVIAHLADAEPAGIGEAPAQRVVDGPVDRPHGRRRGRCRRGSSTARPRRPRRRPAPRSRATSCPGRRRASSGRAAYRANASGRPSRLVCTAVKNRTPRLPAVEDRRPPVRRALDLAGARRGRGVVHRAGRLARRVSLDEAHRTVSGPRRCRRTPTPAPNGS